MPIDINWLRDDKTRGGDPDRWRDMVKKRFADVSLVETTIELDEVRAGVTAWLAVPCWRRCETRARHRSLTR